MKAGDLAIVGSMVSHMIPENASCDCLALTVEAGPALLTEYFDPLSKTVFHDPIFHLNEPQAKNRPLALLLEEIADLRRNQTDFSELIIKGDLCKVFGYVLTHFTAERIGEHDRKALRDVSKIEQALDLIYTKYAEPLTVEYVAEKTGYGKSNFCKIFKQITGTTFHAALNQRRLENACQLLRNTVLPIESIAQQVGFADAKSFCRVFKTAYGTTAGAYRKNKS